MKKPVRKKLFVDKRVQGVLIRQLIVHWVVAALVMFLYLLILQIFSTPEKLSFSGYLSIMWEKYSILLIALASVFPVFVYDSIKLSNRFAGPMVSFRNNLEKLAKGEDVRVLNFRKNDFWHGLSGDLNAVARRMELLNDSSKESAAS